MKSIDVTNLEKSKDYYVKLRDSDCFRNNGKGCLVVRSEDGWEEIPNTRTAETIAVRQYLTPESQYQFTPHKFYDFVTMLKQDPNLTIDTEVRNTGYIKFKNGVLNALTQEFTSDPDDRFIWSTVEANYLPEAKLDEAPAFKEYLDTSLNNEEEPDNRKLLLQILGYVLSDYTTAKAAFMLIGVASSGKSVMLEILKHLVKDGQTSQIAFGSLGNRFSSGLLKDSRINISSELSESGFPSIDAFKALTSCDTIFGERKCQDGFNFKPRTKIICAGNVMPVPKKIDGTDAVIDRLVFLIFKHSIPQSEWNTHLVEDLLAERDVIVSLAVKELKELVANNFKFIEPKDSAEYRVFYKESCNPLQIFLKERTEKATGEYVRSTELFEAFKQFCEDNAYPQNTSPQVFIQTVERLSGIERVRTRKNGDVHPCTYFEGLCLKAEKSSDEDGQ